MMKGFTLVETLVAVAILTIAVSGPLVTAQRAVIAAYTARDQLTASYLAQEAVEYVRAMRDDAYLADPDNAWSDYTASGASTFTIYRCIGAPCTFDPTQAMGVGTGFALNPAAATPLYRLNNGIYSQQSSGGVATVFTRTLTLTTVSATELSVKVTVTWQTSHVTYSINVTDHFTSWQ